MPWQFLLDTNVLSEVVRRPGGLVAQKISEVGEDTVCTSIVVSSELRFRAIKSGSAKLIHQVEAVLSALNVLPFSPPADRHYADLRHVLEKAGTPIGPNDMLIAAHAKSLGLTIVTANIEEFQRVPKLRVVNWLNG
ncbi:MAG: type II toxin-antitoxin system VapC family toxin [Thermodesulfobacteriota bacterium]